MREKQAQGSFVVLLSTILVVAVSFGELNGQEQESHRRKELDWQTKPAQQDNQVEVDSSPDSSRDISLDNSCDSSGGFGTHSSADCFCDGGNPYEWKLGGFLQQSLNTNSRNPTNPPAGQGNWPGTGFIYRNDEYMLNRLYLTLGKAPDTRNGQWGIGGEIDVLYGTDYQFVQSRGLETHGDFTNKWNRNNGVGLFGNGLMGLAMPQAYLEVASEMISVKLGHFYHPLGFVKLDASGPAIGNTQTYSLFYAEFLPVTGGMVTMQLTEQLSVDGGIHRGNGNWDDNNNRVNGFWGLKWTSADQNTLLMYQGDFGAEDDAGANDQYIQSVVFEQRLLQNWVYVFKSDYGYVQNGVAAGQDANFYSFINTLGYQFNEQLQAGIRYEWFNDDDGTRVAFAPGAGDWNGFTVGGTYKVTPSIWIRPEMRWDWFNASNGAGAGPFADGTERSQFLSSVSLFTFF